MRWWVLVLLSACGRIGFDAIDSTLVADAAPIECPASYMTLGDGCYRFVENSNQFDWAINEAVCEADAPTAHLIVIDDQAELQVVLELLEDSSTADVAVGFSDRIVEGDYRTVTGKIAFIEFASNEPDGAGEDCGGVDRGGVVGMEDINCGNANDFICEVDGDAADPSAF